ncbi:MAG: hypothetical protein ABL930_02700 [Pseudobdellovibrio sp.]
MIHFVLFCILWSKPEVKLIEVPVSEYATATVNENHGDFNFYADVFEEKMNSVKITHIQSNISSQVSAPNDYQQRSLSLKLDAGLNEASLDCEMRSKPQPEKVN